MLVLSYLMKSLTSLIKNLVDFYSRNLQHEVSRLVKGTIGKSWEALKKLSSEKNKELWVQDINWKRLGDEFLNKKNMEWVLNKLGELTGAKVDLKDLEGRLAVHLSNIKYAFEKRIKNIAVAVGIAVCLALNINAFSIWKTLYVDQKMQSKFAGSYAEEALELVKQGEKEKEGSEPVTTEQEKKDLEEQTQAMREQLYQFQTNVSFGVGRIWSKPPEETKEKKGWLGFLYEFFGSLLTGIFVSIGAPYWHDLLRALTAIRQPKKKPAAEE
jgi:hypothetical protein